MTKEDLRKGLIPYCIELGWIEFDRETEESKIITTKSEVVNWKVLDYESESAYQYLCHKFPEEDKNLIKEVISENLYITNMRFKCIKKYYVEDSTAMSPGDIVVIAENNLFNITTGVDYKNIPDMSPIKECLEAITDEINPTTKVVSDPERFAQITGGMLDLFIRKNHDYGNSFEESLDEEGLAASRIRLGDKWKRFKNLSSMRDKSLVVESLKDTLIDMANYAIMTVMWMDKGCDSGER